MGWVLMFFNTSSNDFHSHVLIISLNLGTTCLTFEEDPEPFGKVRDYNVKQICKELKIEVIQIVSHTLYKLEKYCLPYNRKNNKIF